MKDSVKKDAENSDLNGQRSIMRPQLIKAFERFVEYHPARRLSRNLRSLLLEFLMYDGSTEAEYLKELVIDLDGLFELLDVADEQWSGIKAEA